MRFTVSLIDRRMPAVLAALATGVLLAATALPAAAAGATPSFVAPGLQRKMQAAPNQQQRVIVQLRDAATAPRSNAQAAQTALAMLRQNGRGGTALGIVRGASGALNAAAINALARDPRVAAIYEDVAVRGRTSGNEAVYPAEVNAPVVRQQGRTGRGITVAVLDSGIAANPDLVQPSNRVVAAANFADTLAAGVQDPGGHGTHVAGIIAGNGSSSNGQYVGIAPNANLVDVRVLDAQGNGSASSVIAGIQWTVAHARDYGIRVLNISLGAPVTTDYTHDPIAAAAEIAWLRGLVVVTAAGNGGANAIESPGFDPYVITVGALDDAATSAVADDSVPTWTAWGTPTGASAKPDVVAPGRRIVSLRTPGSTLDGQLPDHVVSADNGAQYFRLSGTSMATGVVSGVAALLLEAQPALTPAQVKATLMGTTQPFGQSSGAAALSQSSGRGLVDARAATQSASLQNGNRDLRVADPAARALYPVLYGQPLHWRNPLAGGVDWSQQSWSDLIWDDLVWDNVDWDSFAWSDLIWDSLGWSDLIWDSASWTDLIWDSGRPTTVLD